MNIVIFDTETTSLNKPFAYNIGYTIANENGEILLEKDFVVEQIWHNLPLFSTAYFAEKRPIYVKSMRARKTVMKKYGAICREMWRDFKNYNVVCGYAYNSSFDIGVFEFNSNWYKCINPIENMNVYDIRGNVHQFIVNDDYKRFCETNEYYTDSGCYSSTAEIVYRYLFVKDFIEDHTALSDSKIEKDILFETFKRGAEIDKEYTTLRTLGAPNTEKTLHIRTAEQIDYYFDYSKIKINKDKTEITLR